MPASSLTIRPALPSDGQAIKELGDHCYSAYLSESLEAYLSKLRQEQSLSYVVTEPDQTVVAYFVTVAIDQDHIPALNACVSPVPHPTALYCHDLAIQPSYQGQGLARRLIDKVLEENHQRYGFKDAFLVAIAEKHIFWEGFGFTITDTTQKETLATYGLDAVLMHKPL